MTTTRISVPLASPDASVVVGPLAGIVVVDASRMLPGAVLARTLLDLGATVIKVEAPGSGDLLRSVPPQVGGIGAGFHAFYHGALDIALDLSSPAGSAALRERVATADVFIESFRPGTLARWGLDPASLREATPSLITCSISAYGDDGANAIRIGHDGNLAAASGLLSQMGCEGTPRLQIVDVTAGLLAAISIQGALRVRDSTGTGMHIVQPLASGAIPHLAWGYADRAGYELTASSPMNESPQEQLLGGGIPSYRRYVCGDGAELFVGTLEPKLWGAFCALVGAPALAGDGRATGHAAAAIVSAVTVQLAKRTADEWEALGLQAGVPVTRIRAIDEGRSAPWFATQANGRVVSADGALLPVCAPWVASAVVAQGAMNPSTTPPTQVPHA